MLKELTRLKLEGNAEKLFKSIHFNENVGGLESMLTADVSNTAHTDPSYIPGPDITKVD